jgi:hypothetical protein
LTRTLGIDLEITVMRGWLLLTTAGMMSTLIYNVDGIHQIFGIGWFASETLILSSILASFLFLTVPKVGTAFNRTVNRTVNR